VRDKLKGVIPFDTPPHIVEILRICGEYRLIIILKARQIYMTWTMAGLALHGALFQEGSNTVILSKGEIEAGETLDYARFIHSQLPDFLRIGKGSDQSSLITFPAMHSKIRALPATKDAGIGLGGASRIIADEWEFHEYAKENYAEIKPMIDAGGQFIILSAVNKYDQETKFKEVWFKAQAKENNFYPVFLPYNVLSERTEAWYEDQKREYDQWELEGRYPRNEQEALSAPQLVCRFDVQALNAMREDCRSPIHIERNGAVKIYKDSSTNLKYCLAFDPSEGAYDPCGGMIGDWATKEKVVQISGKIPLDEQAQIIFDLYTRYNQPFTAVERNASGLSLIERLKNLGLTNWFHCDKQGEKEGWWTNSANRPVMIGELAEAIRLRQIREPDEDALNQFYSFIRTRKKSEGEARGGAHDEHIMTWGIFLQISKEFPRTHTSFKTYIRRETTY